MSLLTKLMLSACIVVVATGAPWVRDAAGLNSGGDGGNRGNGGGRGGGGGGGGGEYEQMKRQIRARVDSGLGVLQLSRTLRHVQGIRHFTLPPAGKKRFIAAASMELSFLHDYEPNFRVLKTFEAMLNDGLRRVRAASWDWIDVWEPPGPGGSERPLSTIPGGRILGLSTDHGRIVGVCQEGYSALFAGSENLQAQLQDEGAVRLKPAGMRIWIAVPNGLQMPFGFKPFPVAGVDIVVAEPSGRSRLGLVGGSALAGPQIRPWVADAVPGFGSGE